MRRKMCVPSEKGDVASKLLTLSEQSTRLRVSIELGDRFSGTGQYGRKKVEMRILIAEDDPVIQTVLKKVIRDLGSEVTCTSNGEEAYEALQQYDAPQIALFDWMMPKMDGLTLCRKLRAEKRNDHLYIILITSKDAREDIIQGLNAGADDYVTKPFNHEELRARVNVGRRIIAAQNEFKQQQKREGALEMAGAVCHEMNQPMQIILSYSEMLLMKLTEKDPSYNCVCNIRDGVTRLGLLTEKIMSISEYSAKSHMGGKSRIIDLERSTKTT